MGELPVYFDGTRLTAIVYNGVRLGSLVINGRTVYA